MVVSSNHISAAIVDLSPVGKNMPKLITSHMESISIPIFQEPRIIPEWGSIFSPYVCFIRPVDTHEAKSFLKLIDQYLSVLASLMPAVRTDEINSHQTIDRFQYQKRYCLNQKLNDKTRVILSKYFGSSWADEYIDKVLFDL